MFSENGGIGVHEELLRQSCAELARRLRAGESCRAEEFFATHPVLASQAESALELVYTEFAVREELGQRPDPADWYARFPQWRERLERLIQVGELLRVYDVADPITVVETPVVDIGDGGSGTPGGGPWLDRYELLERLGRGGMGVVFKARQLGLNRLVALKMIRAGVDASPDELARFRREAEAMARLRHPNIVQIYAVGECEGLPCFSMELMEGGSLTQRIAGQPVPLRQAAQWMEALAQAVHYAHQQGVVHRDLKPSNVVLTADGVPKVTDFGLAKPLEGEAGHTRSGAVIGTAGYAGPEQAGGNSKEIGPLSDVYALGAVLYELLTGRPPFRGPTQEETLRQVREEEPVPPRAVNPGVDAELEAVCLKCLEKRPARRYASAAALADDLGRWLANVPTLVRPRGRLARLRRFLRRHVRVTAAAALLVIAAVIVPIVLTPSDPDLALNRAQNLLARKQPATLIGGTGGPVWFRPCTNSDDMRLTQTADFFFTVETRKLALVELMPNPQQASYTIHAEVRHDEWYGDPATEVGIYFLHSEYDHGQGQKVHFFCALGFNDQVVYLEKLKLDFPNKHIQGNPVDLTVRRYKEPEDKPAAPRIKCSRDFPIDPLARPGHPVPWRPIRVTVTPKKIEAWWGDKLVGELPRAELLTKWQRNVARGWVDPLPPNLGFDPHDALGLYVCRGVASFRNVVVEPHGEGN